MAFTMRFRDEVDVKKLDQIARSHGLDRTAFLNYLAMTAVEQGFVPMLPGEGYRATASSGGMVFLTMDKESASGTASGLTDEEEMAYQQAQNLADAGFWHPAKFYLRQAGFEVIDVITITS